MLEQRRVVLTRVTIDRRADPDVHAHAERNRKEVRVLLSDRVILNPYAAKRLMLMLEKGLKEYEAKFGELKI